MPSTQDIPEVIWQVDEACMNACPSKTNILLDGWLLRQSGGAVRRPNSLNPLRGRSGNLEQVIGHAESFYQSVAQKPIFRIPSIANEMDQPLDDRGYVTEGESLTLAAQVNPSHFISHDRLKVSNQLSTEWLDARQRILGVSDEATHIFKEMSQLLLLPKLYVTNYHEGEIVSIAYGVLHAGLLVYESVATDEAFRGQGFGKDTVVRSMIWAHDQGIGAACFQVVADNDPAIALYKKIGFDQELYRYHCRVPALD
jgi:GNAT superfamily N-acetyltransferase